MLLSPQRVLVSLFQEARLAFLTLYIFSQVSPPPDNLRTTPPLEAPHPIRPHHCMPPPHHSTSPSVHPSEYPWGPITARHPSPTAPLPVCIRLSICEAPSLHAASPIAPLPVCIHVIICGSFLFLTTRLVSSMRAKPKSMNESMYVQSCHTVGKPQIFLERINDS